MYPSNKITVCFDLKTHIIRTNFETPYLSQQSSDEATKTKEPLEEKQPIQEETTKPEQTPKEKETSEEDKKEAKEKEEQSGRYQIGYCSVPQFFSSGMKFKICFDWLNSVLLCVKMQMLL